MNKNYEKGIRQVEGKQYRNAVKSFTLVIEEESSNRDAYLQRASCYFQLKEFENVIDDMTMAINIDPTYEQFYYNRGAAYVNLHKYDNAINDYGVALALNPNYTNAYYNRASVYMKLENHEKAVLDFMEAAKHGNEDAKIVLKHFEKRGHEINKDKNKKHETN